MSNTWERGGDSADNIDTGVTTPTTCRNTPTRGDIVPARLIWARRWIRIGAFSFQPSELAKLTLILWLASHLAKNALHLDDWRRGTLPAVVPLGIACFLVLVEPDFGTALFLGAWLSFDEGAAVGLLVDLVEYIAPALIGLLFLRAAVATIPSWPGLLAWPRGSVRESSGRGAGRSRGRSSRSPAG